jgi:nucleoside-diphosphate-sugar epimerase
MDGSDLVFHLAANADVRFGLEHPSKDLRQNPIATFNVLEAMRAIGIKRIAFSSPVRFTGRRLLLQHRKMPQFLFRHHCTALRK